MLTASDLLARYVAGESADDAVLATEKLATVGLTATIEHLGDGTDTYLELIGRLADAGLTGYAELLVDPALDGIREICGAAGETGIPVTLADHAVPELVAELRQEYPETGVTLAANLRRTEADCRDLAGTRVRLCKGRQRVGAFRSDRDVGTSYVRCLKVLMNGAGHPVVATHDPRLIEITGYLADRAGRGRDGFEYQLPYGVRPGEQLRLTGAGYAVRVHVPYGAGGYGYLIRRITQVTWNPRVNVQLW